MSPSEIGARLARWRQTGDPNDLWPGLDPQAFRRAAGEIGRVARLALRAGEAPPEALVRPFSVPPRELRVAASVSGMGPLLGYWTERGLIRPDAEHAAVLAEQLGHCRARARDMDGRLMLVLDAFAAHDIPVAVLKGSHTGWEYFPDPGTRSVSDIDLLVAPQDGERAAAALGQLGFRRGAALADGSRADWIPRESPAEPASLELSHRDDPWSVDLHVSLNRTLRFGLSPRFPSPRPQDGPRRTRNGRAFHVLPQPLLLLWLAFHAVGHLEIGPMVRYLELVLVTRRDFSGRPGLWEEFLDLGHRTRSLALAFPALVLGERLAPGTIPPQVLHELARSAPWVVRRVVRRLRPETVQQLFRLSLDVRIMWLPSLPGLRGVLAGLSRRRRQGFAGRNPVLAWLRGQMRRLVLLLRGRLSLRARD